MFAILGTIIIIVVMVNISVTYMKIADFKKESTGNYLTYVNLSINNYVGLDMIRGDLDWGPGSIASGSVNATLYTSGDNQGIVNRGNWSGTTAKAFIVRNVGNINSTLYIQAGKNAHDLFNSATGSNEEYMLNVTNKKANSCSGGAVLGVWTNVNKTGMGTKYCSEFSSLSGSNELYIDVLLTVPLDSNNIGNLSDTLTLTATASG